MYEKLPDELLKTQYISSGLFVSDGEWIHPSRVIDSYEIIYVVEGCVFIQEEDEMLSAKKNNILLLYPGRKHFGTQKSTGKTSFYWLHFTDTKWVTSNQINQFLILEDPYHMNLLFKQLLHISNTPEYPDFSTSLLLWLILTELWTKQNENVRKVSPMAKSISEWIRINSNRKITVSDVAEEFCYSEDYISRLFRKSFSMAMKDYINEMRMKTIKNLLLSTTFPIKQIAHESGFKDYKNFIKYFKYHEKISPAEFRKIYFNTHLNKK